MPRSHFTSPAWILNFPLSVKNTRRTRTTAAEQIRTAAVWAVVNPKEATYRVTIPMDPHKMDDVNTRTGASFFIIFLLDSQQSAGVSPQDLLLFFLCQGHFL